MGGPARVGTSMTRYVVDEPAFRALVRGAPIGVGADHEIILLPTLGWVRQLQALVDAIQAGRPEGAPAIRLRPNPPDPPEAREFLPTARRQK